MVTIKMAPAGMILIKNFKKCESLEAAELLCKKNNWQLTDDKGLVWYLYIEQ